jgi:hypothetical protein
VEALKCQIERIDAILGFLTRNPVLAEHTNLKRMSTGTGLYFEDKGYIRPVATSPVRLQLEKHIEVWNGEDSDAKIICNDVRFYSPVQLKDILKEIGVDLEELHEAKDEDECASWIGQEDK